MESFVALVITFCILGTGVIIGNLNGTNDISNREIAEANRVCEPSDGVYKINKGFKEAIAFCKDGNQIKLKGEK